MIVYHRILMIILKNTVRIGLIFVGLVAVCLAGGASAWALALANLSQPDSVVVDQKTGDYYISSVGGPMDAKDANGYISRISSDGVVVVLRFIESKPGIYDLHAPKGLVIRKDLLWIVDLDAVKAFKLESGEFVRAVVPPDPKSLNDIAVGSDGMLYVSDMIANRIYKIDPDAVAPAAGAEVVEGAPDDDHVGVTVFKEGEELGQPNGLCFNRFTKHLMVLSSQTGNLIEIDPKGATRVLKTGFESPDGLASDLRGTLYVSSPTKGEIYSIASWGRGPMTLFQSGLKEPADIFYDAFHRELHIPVTGSNSILSYPIEEKRARNFEPRSSSPTDKNPK